MSKWLCLNINIVHFVLIFVVSCKYKVTKSNEPNILISNTKKTIDTIFYANGKPKEIKQWDTLTQQTNYFIFYYNGILKSSFTMGDVYGCENIIGNEKLYDSTGLLTEVKTYKHILPKDKKGCHSTFTIQKISNFYSNGNLKLESSINYFYEGEECNCGFWKYYDKKGYLIKTIKYTNCQPN